MPLTNFGSILTFAEEIEIQDMAFYSGVVSNPDCEEFKPLVDQFIKESKKLIAIVQRTRRENVTEMILEPVNDFTRAPFCIDPLNSNDMTAATVLETVKKIEQRSSDYYSSASLKMKALIEVSNALKLLSKKHAARLEKVTDI